MSALTNYLENKILDHLFKATSFSLPAGLYVALLTVSKGQRANTTVYALNDTVWLTANDAKTHIYKVTTAGTSAAAQSTLFPGVANEAIVDGTATLTEQSSAIAANTYGNEVSTSGTTYARVSVPPSATANWNCTQGGVTGPNSGTNGTTANANVITFGAPSANWGIIAGFMVFDAVTAGNPLIWGTLTVPKTVNNADAAPTFPSAALSFQIDSN